MLGAKCGEQSMGVQSVGHKIWGAQFRGAQSGVQKFWGIKYGGTKYA